MSSCLLSAWPFSSWPSLFTPWPRRRLSFLDSHTQCGSEGKPRQSPVIYAARSKPGSTSGTLGGDLVVRRAGRLVRMLRESCRPGCREVLLGAGRRLARALAIAHCMGAALRMYRIGQPWAVLEGVSDHYVAIDFTAAARRIRRAATLGDLRHVPKLEAAADGAGGRRLRRRAAPTAPVLLAHVEPDLERVASARIGHVAGGRPGCSKRNHGINSSSSWRNCTTSELGAIRR